MLCRFSGSEQLLMLVLCMALQRELQFVRLLIKWNICSVRLPYEVLYCSSPVHKYTLTHQDRSAHPSIRTRVLWESV